MFKDVSNINSRVRFIVSDLIDRSPDFIKSIIVFGSACGMCRMTDDSDLDLMVVVENLNDDLLCSKDILDFAGSIKHENDILFEDSKTIKDKFNNGNCSGIYKSIWESGIVVYVSDDWR